MTTWAATTRPTTPSRATTPTTCSPGRPHPQAPSPPGWEWTWELTAQGSDATDVRLTYDWSKVADPELLKKVSFPFVSQQQLEDSLANLAAASGR